MGQYYKTVIVRTGGDTNNKDIITVDNDCNFRDGWCGLKLMEHSYLNNIWTDSIASFIYKNKVRMAHVGDYADEYPQYQLAYNENVKTEPLDVSDMYEPNMYDDGETLKEFDYNGKYLINWDKREYISFDHWKQKNKVSWDDDVYTCPFTILTALGNGRGGGDYYSEYPHSEDVGSWAWDEISIEDKVPEGYTELSELYFKE